MQLTGFICVMVLVVKRYAINGNYRQSLKKFFALLYFTSRTTKALDFSLIVAIPPSTATKMTSTTSGTDMMMPTDETTDMMMSEEETVKMDTVRSPSRTVQPPPGIKVIATRWRINK